MLVADLQDRLAVLNPHLHEGVPLAEAARRAGVPRRTATRWLAAFQAGGVLTVARDDDEGVVLFDDGFRCVRRHGDGIVR